MARKPMPVARIMARIRDRARDIRIRGGLGDIFFNQPDLPENPKPLKKLDLLFP
jgi:hypothetical protein